MGNTNANLHKARKARQDEFYTQYEDIEKELIHYKEQLKDMVIYCNCDSEKSNFVKFFKDNYNEYQLKGLIATHYNKDGRSYRLDYKNGELIKTPLEGNGDFRSEECKKIARDEADIIITNPPFSLFREYYSSIKDKKFLILGNQNAITYKEIFPHIKDKELWLGYNSNRCASFILPEDYEKYSLIENGVKIGKVPGINWFTNLQVNKENKVVLVKAYNTDNYPKYDNYDAINVDKLKDIPYDYNGVMGVPITIVDKISSDGLIHLDSNQYKIIGCFNGYKESNEELGLFTGEKTRAIQSDGKIIEWTGPTVNEHTKYFRVLIKKIE